MGRIANSCADTFRYHLPLRGPQALKLISAESGQRGGKRMSFMTWSDSLATGIGSIDEQHQWLVNATNQLHAEMTQPTPDRAVLGEIFEGLVDYTMNHFVLEEELFQRFGYPETAAHKAEHDALTAQVMQLLLKFEEGENVGTPVLDFLKEWLLHHILKVDRAYAPFLQAAGVH